MASGSEPDQPPVAPDVLTFDSATAMTIGWQAPLRDGGFSVTKYTLYRDSVELVNLDPSRNFFQLTDLELGKSYKLQVSASNEIGESSKSVVRTLRHANVPSAP